MYCQFGQKWAKLFHGPMWSVTRSDNIHERRTMEVYTSLVICTAFHLAFFMNTGYYIYMCILNCYGTIHHIQALTNIPSLSERTLRRDIASSEVTMDSKIQVRYRCDIWLHHTVSCFRSNIFLLMYDSCQCLMRLPVHTLGVGGG